MKTTSATNARAHAQRTRMTFVQHVTKRIQDGTWPPGHRLPPERELVKLFKVARNTLRKSLDELERTGVVERHVGRGTFIANTTTLEHASAESLISRVHGASPSDVMELRLLLEPPFIELAAVRATARDLAHIQHCLRESEKASNVIDFEHWDGMLHQAILAATHNHLLTDLYEVINGVRRQPEWEALKRRSLTAERLAAYRKQHRNLVKALVARDPVRARDTVREHLLEVSRGLGGER